MSHSDSIWGIASHDIMPMPETSSEITPTRDGYLRPEGSAYRSPKNVIDTMTLNLQPTLFGPQVTLVPLNAQDFESLFAVARDPLIWEQHPDSLRYQRPVFERFFADALASGGAFAIRDRLTETIIGSSRFYEWDPKNREIAIGYTFLDRRYWGGKTNAEVKRLMLDHAFTRARLAWFHVGKNNLRSRIAMQRIGASFSHTAPKELNGVVQDFVFYKIEAPLEL